MSSATSSALTRRCAWVAVRAESCCAKWSTCVVLSWSSLSSFCGNAKFECCRIETTAKAPPEPSRPWVAPDCLFTFLSTERGHSAPPGVYTTAITEGAGMNGIGRNVVMGDEDQLSRRSLLKGMAVVGAGTALGGCGFFGRGTGGPHRPFPFPLRQPGSRPNPRLPEGTDTIPQIEHIVVVMLENHSYDDHFGMLGRGDGFRLDKDGRPLHANPDGKGTLIRSFHMPSTCQLRGAPGQNWNASHTAFDGGRNDGFVKGGGPVAMWAGDGAELPSYYGLGRPFPWSDRWFCSVLAQTYPNRRFLTAGPAPGVGGQ